MDEFGCGRSGDDGEEGRDGEYGEDVEFCAAAELAAPEVPARPAACPALKAAVLLTSPAAAAIGVEVSAAPPALTPALFATDWTADWPADCATGAGSTETGADLPFCSVPVTKLLSVEFTSD